MLSGRCPVDRDAVVMNGHDLEKNSLPFLADGVQNASRSCRMSYVSVGSLSGHCLISVGSHLGESGRCRDRFGSFFYHAKDTNRIRIGLKTGESGRIRLETAESGRFPNNI